MIVRTNKEYYTVKVLYDEVKDILKDYSTVFKGE